MYRKVVVLAVLLLLMVFVGSCERREFQPASKPLTELERKQGAIDALSDSWVTLHKQIQAVEEQAQELAARCDSVAERNQELEQENAKLKAQLAQARDEVIPSMRQQYEHTYELLRLAYQELEGELKTTRQSLNSTESKCSVIQAERDGLQCTLDQVKPWYAKYKHDATERNVLEKLFGADKAPVPDFPEPQLE